MPRLPVVLPVLLRQCSAKSNYRQSLPFISSPESCFKNQCLIWYSTQYNGWSNGWLTNFLLLHLHISLKDVSECMQQHDTDPLSALDGLLIWVSWDCCFVMDYENVDPQNGQSTDSLAVHLSASHTSTQCAYLGHQGAFTPIAGRTVDGSLPEPLTLSVGPTSPLWPGRRSVTLGCTAPKVDFSIHFLIQLKWGQNIGIMSHIPLLICSPLLKIWASRHKTYATWSQ